MTEEYRNIIQTAINSVINQESFPAQLTQMEKIDGVLTGYGQSFGGFGSPVVCDHRATGEFVGETLVTKVSVTAAALDAAQKLLDDIRQAIVKEEANTGKTVTRFASMKAHGFGELDEVFIPVLDGDFEVLASIVAPSMGRRTTTLVHLAIAFGVS